MGFDLPIIEIFVLALVSGLVTCATVFFSAKAAREQTERTLAAHQMTELRGAILTLAQEADEHFKDGDWGAAARSMAAYAADITIRTSGRYGAKEAARWARLFRQYAVVAALDKGSLEGLAFFLDTWSPTSDGPGQSITAELSEWLMNPEEKTPQLEEQARDYHVTLMRFVNRLNSEEAQRYADEN